MGIERGVAARRRVAVLLAIPLLGFLTGCPDSKKIVESTFDNDALSGKPRPDAEDATLEASPEADVSPDVDASELPPPDVDNSDAIVVDIAPPNDIDATPDATEEVEVDAAQDADTADADVAEEVDAQLDTGGDFDSLGDTDAAADTESDATADTESDATADTEPDATEDVDGQADAVAEVDTLSDADGGAVDGSQDGDASTLDDGSNGSDDSAETDGTDGLDGDATTPECFSASDCVGVLGVCQAWSCDAGTCIQLPASNGTPCSSGTPCLGGESCSAGACTGGALDCEGCAAEPACIGSTCANPIVIGALSFTTSGDTAGKVDSDLVVAGDCPSLPSGYGGASPDVFYAFTAPNDGDYTIALSGLQDGLDAGLSVRSSCTLASPDQCVAAADVSGGGGETLNVSLSAGETYYIVIDGGLASTGPGAFELSVDTTPECLTATDCGTAGLCSGWLCDAGTCVPDPVADGTDCDSDPCLDGETCSAGTCAGGTLNCSTCASDPGCPPAIGDNCVTPLPIATLPFAFDGDTGQAPHPYSDAVQVGAGACNDGAGGTVPAFGAGAADTVFGFTPASDGLYRFSIDAGGSLDTGLAVVTTCALSGSPGECLGASDGSGLDGEVVDVALTAGVPYFVVVDGGAQSTGPGAFTFRAEDVSECQDTATCESLYGPAETCQVWACQSGTCSAQDLGDGTGCSSGAQCVTDESCTAGMCGGGVPDTTSPGCELLGDTCAMPELIDSLPFTDNGTTVGFSDAHTVPGDTCFDGAAGVMGAAGAGWPDKIYSFTPALDGFYEVRLLTGIGTLDGALSVAEGCPLSGGATCIAGNDVPGMGGDTVEVQLFAATNYTIVVDGGAAATGPGSYQLVVDQITECTTAIECDNAYGAPANPCMMWTCDGLFTCQQAPVTDGTFCSDPATCTLDGMCSAGTCGGGGVDCVSCPVEPACLNPGNTCGAPIVVTGVPFVYPGDTSSGFTDDSSVPSSFCPAVGGGTTSSFGASSPDVFFQFTPGATGDYTIGLNSSGSLDSGLWIGTSCPLQQASDCVVADDLNGSSGEEATVSLVEGVTYTIGVDGGEDPSTGTFELNIELAPECVVAADCDFIYGGPPSACQLWTCDGSGTCASAPMPPTTSCDTDSCFDGQQCDGAGACIGGTVNCTNCPTQAACALAGDSCSTAIIIEPTSLPYSDVGDTSSFNDLYGVNGSPADCPNVGGGDAPNGGFGAPEVVYSFTPAETGEYIIRTTALAAYIDSYLSLQTSCPIGGPGDCMLAQDFIGDGGEELVATLNAGTPYWIVVDGFGNSPAAIGPYELTVELAPPPNPCDAKAISIPAQTYSFSTTGDNGSSDAVTTIGAGCPSAPPLVADTGFGKEDVYRFTAPIDDTYTFTLSNQLTSGDVALAVTTQCPLVDDATHCVGASDVAGPMAVETVSVSLTAGEMVYVLADSRNPGDETFYTLTITNASGPPSCSDKAVDISYPLPFVVNDGNTTGATNTTEMLTNECPDQVESAGTIATASGQAGEDVYRFTAAAAGEYSAILEALEPGDSLTLYVTDTCPLQTGSCRVGSNGAGVQEIVTFTLAAGEEVFLVVDGALPDAAHEGAYTLIVNTTAFETQCTDTIDDDYDGRTDCEDPDCDYEPVCAALEDCTDSIDNDGDGATDCDDGSCYTEPSCFGGGCSTDVTIAPPLPYVAPPNWDSTLEVDDFFIPAGTCPDDIVGGTLGYDVGGGGDLLFEYTPDQSGDHLLQVNSHAGADHILAVLSNCPTGGTVFPSDCIFISDDISALTTISMNLQAGVTYFFLVDAGGTNAGGLFDFQVLFLGSELPGECNDDIDNEGDFRTDCHDPDCFGVGPKCDTEQGIYCGDNLDNDLDGLKDCSDSDCFGLGVCTNEGYAIGECADLEDNDGDTLVDCQDPDCAGKDGCPVMCDANFEVSLTGGTYVHSGNTDGATNASAQPVDTCPGDSASRGALAPDHVYRFVPDVAGTYAVTLDSTTADHSLQVTDSCPPPESGTCLAGDYAAGNGGESLTVTLNAGLEYFIVVDGPNDTTTSGGAYTLTITAL